MGRGRPTFLICKKNVPKYLNSGIIKRWNRPTDILPLKENITKRREQITGGRQSGVPTILKDGTRTFYHLKKLDSCPGAEEKRRGGPTVLTCKKKFQILECRQY